MNGRLGLIVVTLPFLMLAGCQCGGWNCHSGPWTTPHSINAGLTDCGGCGVDTCSTCTTGCETYFGACDACGRVGCTGCAPVHGPLQHLRYLSRKSICGDGCASIYWDEWISQPPDCCDPCDPCTAHWTGYRGGCGPRGGVSALFRSMLGKRHGACGCSDCVSGAIHYGSDDIIELPERAQPDSPPDPMPEDTVQRLGEPRRFEPQPRTISQTSLSDPTPLGTGVRRAGYTRR